MTDRKQSARTTIEHGKRKDRKIKKPVNFEVSLHISFTLLFFGVKTGKTKNPVNVDSQGFNDGMPGRIRTCDLQSRRSPWT